MRLKEKTLEHANFSGATQLIACTHGKFANQCSVGRKTPLKREVTTGGRVDYRIDGLLFH